MCRTLCSLGVALTLAACGPLWGQELPSPAPPSQTPEIAELSVDPGEIKLRGRTNSFAILTSAKTVTGHVIDTTASAQYRSGDEKVAVVSAEGIVSPRGNGETFVEVTLQGKSTRVTVRIVDFDLPRQFHFENDVLPILSRYSCNTSSCHGKAEGQNGFKLSVFAFDARGDFEALAMEGRGRRTFPAAPQRSLLLTKPSGEIPHAGGLRIPRGSSAYETLRGWITAGMPFDPPGSAKVVGIALSPRERLLEMGDRQQLRVVARYSDGAEIDVTGLSRFQSNDEGLATVTTTGMVNTGTVPGSVAIMAAYMGEMAVFQALVPRSEKIQNYPELPANNFIDPLVHQRLKKLNILPSEGADDAEYLRRVYLDVIGTLPTAGEARAFLADARTDRRARLVDELLKRPEFNDYWALKWADLLKVDRGPLGRKGAHNFYRWIRERIAAGQPLDQFVQDLITAEGPTGEVAQTAFFKVDKKPGQWSSNVSQVFLGIRITCAECHHHPYDRWSQTDYFGMQAFFTPIRLRNSPRGEVLESAGDPATKHPRSGEPIFAYALGTEMPAASPTGDRRRVLAAWLAAPENPWFARNLSNRLWDHFLGRGLVEPVDDVRETNPPTNPELLDALAKHLVEKKFDLREMIRTITASRTYQQSSRPNATNERDEQNFSRALFKRLEAEVLLDAVCQTTGVEEKFEGLPAGYRAIQLWDNRVPHYFLKLFGRPVRATACECERSVEASVGQVLHLMNSPQIQSKLSHAGGTIAKLARETTDDSKLVEELYLTYYNRMPSDQERQTAVAHLKASGDRTGGAEDLAWSMLNTIEFVFNH